MRHRCLVSVGLSFAALTAASERSFAAEPATPASSGEASAPAEAPPAPKLGRPTQRTHGESARVRYTLEGIELRGNFRTAAHVLLHHVRFREGDSLDVDDPEVELTRYRLLGTGFFSSVDLSLRKGSARGSAVLVIDVVERNTLVVRQLWLGVAADEDTAGRAKPISPFLGLDVAETNLAGAGITLGAGVALAADQLALRTQFVDPTFGGTRWSAGVSLLYADARDFFGNRSVRFESPLPAQHDVTDYAIVAYKRFGGIMSTGVDLSSASRLQIDYHLEQIDAVVPSVASHVVGQRREPIDFGLLNQKSVLSSARVVASYDTRDRPFLTTQGSLASIGITASATPLGSDYGYQKLELAAQRWWSLPYGHVVRLESFAGTIAGNAPLFDKFYVGDFSDLLPDRLLELAPDRRRPSNYLGTDIVEIRYGDAALKLGAEYRIPIHRGHGAVYGVDLFGSFGVYAVADRQHIRSPPPGYLGWARVPADLTYNFGLRVDTSAGGMTLAFSNLLGLVPMSGGATR